MITTWALGPLVYDPGNQQWLAFVRLPLFEVPPPCDPPPAETVDEIWTQIDAWSRELEQSYVPPPRTAQEDFDDWDFPGRPSRRELRECGLGHWLDKLERLKRAEGLTCVVFTPDDADPPRPIQEATVRHLITNEAAIHDAVVAALTRSSADSGPDAEAVSRARVGTITVHNDGLDGLAPIVFSIDCEWGQEHGVEVAYHPRIGAVWAASCESDLAAALPEPPPPTPAEELAAAIFAGDEGRIRALLADGVRADGSSLYYAIHELHVEMVRQLLAAGADPNHRDVYEGNPLAAARRALAHGTMTVSRRVPWWARVLAFALKFVYAGEVCREGRKGRAVIRLLIDAGAK